MSNSEEKSYVTNGTNGVISEPMHRLASFKSPRDLTLGGIKPSKKVFTPNLNVIRKKTKGPAPLTANTNNHIKDDKGKRERRNDRNKHPNRHEPNIMKSSGVFSEGVGKIERPSNRESYRSWSDGGGDVMQKPALRVKKGNMIDKELEDQKIKMVMNGEDMVDHVLMDFGQAMALDAPIQLPMGLVPMDTVDRKFLLDVKRAFGDSTEASELLQETQPTLLLLQLPDALPGRGGAAAEEPPRRKPAEPNAAPAPEEAEPDKTDEPCHLRSLEEGRIGTLRLHRSGRVSMVLGNTTFEISKGMRTSFYQEVVSVGADEGSRSANLVSLGPLEHRLTAVPDWEALFGARS